MDTTEEEKTGLVAKPRVGETVCGGFCHTNSTCYRYTLMVIVSIVGFGDYFSYDVAAALEDHILTDLDLSESRYMVFNSSIHWIQIVACFCGGYLVDKVLGVRASIVLSAFGLTLAQSLFAGGALLNSYWTMVIGRALYGAMGGLVSLAINTVQAMWFKDRELSFAIGLKMSLGRAGTVLSINLLDQLYSAFNKHHPHRVSLALSLFVGVFVCLVSAVFSIVYFYMDKRAKSSCAEDMKNQGTISFRNVRRFPVTFWLVTMILPLYVTAIFTFTGLGQVFFERKFDLKLDVATNLNSMVYLIGVFALPVMGIVIDKVGRSMYWMLAGILLQAGGHLLLGLTFANPYIAMSLLGTSFTITSLSLWPLIAYTVQMDYLATANGIVRAFVCLTESGSTYLAGYLAENHGYLSVEINLLVYSSVALIFACLLFIIDKARGGYLNLKPSERILFDEHLL